MNTNRKTEAPQCV